MILSDVSIRKALAEGRIEIEPLGENAIQPSSVDVHIDRYFRVFRNDTTPFIDPRLAQEDLTELVEIDDERAFILHPGEFVLASTLERVAIPDDMVGRLEGKSSLGRLGLLIHSSLPADEAVYVLDGDRLEPRPISQVVQKQLRAFVVAFDPKTFEVGYHAITGWYEGPADRIFEVRLRSGRSVRCTAGHNLFTIDRTGALTKVRTGQLPAGTKVAVPRRIPDPMAAAVPINVVARIPETEYEWLTCEGPTVAAAFESHVRDIQRALQDSGYKHFVHYQRNARLPLHVAAQIPGLLAQLGSDDRLGYRGGRTTMPAEIPVDEEFAWLLGMYIAEGSRRSGQFTISNTVQPVLDRVEAILRRLGMPVYRGAIVVTCCSTIGSRFLDWVGAGGYAQTKRLPPMIFGWPQHLIRAFFDGIVEGDGRIDSERTSIWTTSPDLVSDLLVLCSRIGARAGTSWKSRSGISPICQLYMPHNEHKLLTSVPLPDELLIELRGQSGLDQKSAARAAGYKNASDLNNIERRSGRDALRVSTLRRLRDAYASAAGSDDYARLERLIDGDLMWDEVDEVVDTGEVQPIYDIEVRPDGRKIENFLVGTGGVFVSNTAGFVDAGWNGHLTLELSNVANLPIAIYANMKIGQISFLQMTTPAEHPYGSGETKSKYQGQRGPTPSRSYLNFPKD